MGIHYRLNYGFEKIWKIVNLKYGFHGLKTRYCNQDPIENFFKQIKSHGICNVNLTSHQFQDPFITLLISNMKSVSVIEGNCETTKDSFMLFSLEKYLEDDLSNSNVCDSTYRSNDDNESHEILTNTVCREESSIQFVLEYSEDIAIIKEFNYCHECTDGLRNSEFPIVTRQ